MRAAADLVHHRTRTFHVRRTARERYGIDDTLLGIRGDLAVADLAAIRLLAQRMNEARPPEAAGVSAGEIGALGLLHEIGHLVVGRQQASGPSMAEAMRDVRRRLHDDLDHLLDRYGAAFPGAGPDPEPRVVQLEELLLTRVSNENPAIGLLLLLAAATGVLGAVLKATLIVVLSLVLSVVALGWVATWYARRRMREFHQEFDRRIDHDRRRQDAYDVGEDPTGRPRIGDGA